MRPVLQACFALMCLCEVAAAQVVIPRFQGELSRDEARLISGMRYSPSDKPARWLADGRLVIAHQERFHSADVFSVTCSGSGLFAVPAAGRGVAEPLAVGAPGCEYARSLDGGDVDPTGRWGVYSAYSVQNNKQLKRIRFPGNAVDVLPVDCAADLMKPSISPDARRIAAHGLCRTRNSEYELYVIDVDSWQLRRIASDDSASYTSPNWAPDGTRLAFDRRSVSGADGTEKEDVLVVDVDGANVRRIASGFAPSWSPSGEWIAFLAQNPERRGEFDIRLVSPDGTRERLLYANRTRTTYSRGFGPRTEGEVFGSLVWSPDGRELAFSRAFDRGISVWVISVESGSPRQVTGR